MLPARINKKLLRRKMAEKDIFTFTDLAQRIHRTPTTVHLMIERPSRYTAAVDLTLGVLGLKSLSEITNEIKDKTHV